MFCKHCGAKNDHELKFCNSCGKELGRGSSETKSSPKTKSTSKKKISKVKLILVGILVVVFIAAAIACVLFFKSLNDPQQKIIKSLEKEDYETAVDVYKENYKYGDGNIDNLVKALGQRIENLKDEFKNSNIDYAAIKIELETIEELDIGELSYELSDAMEYIDKINDSRIAFNTAEELFKKGDYIGAINQYKLVDSEDLNSDNAKSGVSKATDEYRKKVLETANNYADDEDYDKAIKTLEDALEIISSDSEITQRLNVFNANKEEQELQQNNEIREQALNEAEEYKNAGDWPNAIAALNDALKELPEDIALIGKIDEYEKSYGNYVLARANELLALKNYDDAVLVVNDALKELPDNSELSEMIETIKEAKPKSLFTLTALNSNYYWKESKDTLEDSLGRTYTVTYPYAVFQYDAYGEYYIDKGYSNIKGRIVPYKGFYQNGVASFKVYADDVLVYSSPDIGQKTLEFDFNVNIVGADYIKIEVSNKSSSRILVMDMVLEK